jgi:tRNA-(ms[2]io[6]A)-hydroxylase
MVPVVPGPAAAASWALAVPTPPAWARSQLRHLDELLVEQAHLEKKAAAAAVSFLFRIGGPLDDHRALSALAREELVHFERTLRLLAQRGIPFGPQASSGYAEALKAGIGGKLPERLADELLVAAIIEARSCERMGLLADALRPVDAELADFYAELVLAEARHGRDYVELAQRLLPASHVEARLGALLVHEAHVLASLPWSARLHGGLPQGAELAG